MANQAPRPYTIIDLTSDDDENDCHAANQGAAAIGSGASETFLDVNREARNEVELTSDESTFHPAPWISDKNKEISEEECVQRIIDVLPDITVNYVLSQFLDEDRRRTLGGCEELIFTILESGVYPTEEEGAGSRKRKRDDEDEFAEFEAGTQVEHIPNYEMHVLTMLKDEFPTAPVRHIENTFKDAKSLFNCYLTLERQIREHKKINHTLPKRPICQPHQLHGRSDSTADHPSVVIIRKELEAAKRKLIKEQAKRVKEQDDKLAEEHNLIVSMARGEINECQCCFDEFPINRMTYCDSDNIHFMCLTCARKAVESEMSLGRCRPKCFADTACRGLYSRGQLQQFMEPRAFQRLERMQQREDLVAAGLDFLDECPFCDYKAECPPVEIDKEFRCVNPTCRRVSCRLCHKETHIPKSCEEVRKDTNITVRHQVEEAMTDAIIRKCNRCKNPFIKESGCNKMTCTKCGNLQCYVCSKDVKDYNHFTDGLGDRRTRTCPLHDNVELRHQEEAKKAEAEAYARIRAQYPDITEDELKIQVSEDVKKEETVRRGRAQALHAGFPFHMQGNMLLPGTVPGAPGHLPPGFAANVAHRPIAHAGIPPPLLPNIPVMPIQHPRIQVCRAHLAAPQLDGAHDAPLVPFQAAAQHNCMAPVHNIQNQALQLQAQVQTPGYLQNQQHLQLLVHHQQVQAQQQQQQWQNQQQEMHTQALQAQRDAQFQLRNLNFQHNLRVSAAHEYQGLPVNLQQEQERRPPQDPARDVWFPAFKRWD